MAKSIEPRLWLNQAKALPVGSTDKIIHKGCGNRPSLFIKNDDDTWWCYCHRCRTPGQVNKANPRVKQKLAQKTGWMPDKIIPMMEAVVSEPYNFRDIFERFKLAPYVSDLRFSPDTKRIYFPDESDSYLGLDATGLANARFYSPHKRAMATYRVGAAGVVHVTGELAAYLENVRNGVGSVLVMNRAGEDAALAALSGNPDAQIVIGKYLKDQFVRSLRVL